MDESEIIVKFEKTTGLFWSFDIFIFHSFIIALFLFLSMQMKFFILMTLGLGDISLIENNAVS